MNTKAIERWTEPEVFARLASAFPSPAHTLLCQVRNGTGYARRRTRTADAIAVSTWPSRGLYFAGIEIKVARHDWKRELADPQKADDFHKYCRYWWVAAPAGVVELPEVPETWGYLEVSRKQCKFVRGACANLAATSPDMLLLCSILRAVEEATVPKRDVDQRIRDEVAKHVDAARKHADFERDEARKIIRAFEEAAGVNMKYEWDGNRVGTALRTVLSYSGGPEEIVKRMKTLARDARQAIDRLEQSFLADVAENPIEA